MITKLVIDVSLQRLSFLSAGLHRTYRISTSFNGVGQLEGSNCTPLGAHIVKEKIGYRAHPNTIFKGRVALDSLFDESNAKDVKDDYILSRILWLSGTEPGFNRLGSVDTKLRYIYIHGTHEEHLLGSPASHGCVRMSRSDVIELFDLVPIYTQVLIVNE